MCHMKTVVLLFVLSVIALTAASPSVDGWSCVRINCQQPGSEDACGDCCEGAGNSREYAYCARKCFCVLKGLAGLPPGRK